MRTLQIKTLLGIFLLLNLPLSAAVVYVDVNVGGGSNDGSSWNNAYSDLSVALGATGPGNEIWVAAGEYKPDSADRAIFFVLPENVTLYGGFSGSGTEVSESERDWVNYPTLIQGDIGAGGTDTDNSKQLISMGNLSVLDGFIVENVYNSDGVDGGAIRAVHVEDYTIKNCVIQNNYASQAGAGFYTYHTSGGRGEVINTVFDNNTANGFEGGGAYNYGSGDVNYFNCIFVNNTCGRIGGGLAHYTSTGNIVNCTIVKNHAGQDGGGLHARSTAVVYNTIVRDNTIGTGTYINTYNWGGGNPLVYNSNIQGDGSQYTDAGGVIDSAEVFVDLAQPSGSDSIWFADPDGLMIDSGSPSIDTGISNALVPTEDILGNTRSAPDIGAYEFGAANNAPVANADSPVTSEDTPLAITLSGTDGDGDPLTYILDTSPTNGMLTGTEPDLTYTPDADFFGMDSFDFKVNDGTIDSAVATITINVTAINDMPYADAQSVNVIENNTLNITLTGGDVDGDGLTYFVVMTPANGTLSGSAPSLTYTPSTDYVGVDSFDFKVNDGTVDSSQVTVTVNVNSDPAPPLELSLVAAGQRTFFAVDNSNVLFKQGLNSQSQMGEGGTFKSSPTPFPALGQVISIKSGAAHSLALDATGNVLAFGSNTFSQSGASHDNFVQVPGLTDVRQIACGAYTSYALDASGDLFAWGRNNLGQLGLGDTNNRLLPTSVSLPSGNVREISAGVEHLLVRIDDAVYGCGSNGFEQLAQGSSTLFCNSLVLIDDSRVYASIGAGGFHSFAIDDSMQLYGWGKNNRGQLGDVSFPALVITPSLVSGVSSVMKATGGYAHSLFLTSGSLYVAGDNSQGQLGPANSSLDFSATPQMISGLSSISDIAAGPYSAMVAESSGIISIWGMFVDGSSSSNLDVFMSPPVN
ncbi:MAG: cadherin-like domain-containing protein [Planctomycetes bacterium]|nr:cadherin-like domain-containing protein [Planctomycetota bacterium]